MVLCGALVSKGLDTRFMVIKKMDTIGLDFDVRKSVHHHTIQIN